MSRPNPLKWIFNFVASVKVAIPLLVLIAVASIVGSLIPQGRNVKPAEDAAEWVRKLNDALQLNDIFHSWWYLALLGLLGLCLMAVTVKRVPTVWRQRGRGPAVGIFLAHLGILVMLVGMIYGALSGFRYYVHLVEGEVTVLPPLPFVIKLDRLDLKYHSPERFDNRMPKFFIAEKQESHLSLLRHGTAFLQATAAPGQPFFARGVTLLPSQKDVGWAFDLVLQAGGQEKVVPIRPWAPPLITLGFGNTNRILAHWVTEDGRGPQGPAGAPSSFTTEIFLLREDRTTRSLGFASQREPLKFGAWTVSVGTIRRYTGLHIYRRPERPFLIAGIVSLIIGMVGYFTRWGRGLLPSRYRGGAKKEPPLAGRAKETA
jgi:hypothetical protein